MRLRAIDRRRREVRMFAAAMQQRTAPVLAQIIPIRRCNLACTYCNEFDHSSQPVPLSEMLASGRQTRCARCSRRHDQRR